MKNITIHSLRKAGFRCRVSHFRIAKQTGEYCTKGQEYSIKYFRDNKIQSFIKASGGHSLVEITTPNKVDYTFTALCSKKDSFNRKLALSICLGRAQGNFELNNEIKGLVK